MKKQRIIFTLMLCACMIFTATGAMAADVTTDGGTGSVPIPVTAAAATFSVTVPTSLAISVDASGVVSTASNAVIENKSCGAVKVTNVTITGKNGWATVDYDTANMRTEKVNAKKLAFMINTQKTTGADTMDVFSAANFTVMTGTDGAAGGTDEMAITYGAKVPAQASALTDVAVADVTFTIGWDLV